MIQKEGKDRKGNSKTLPSCTLPITAINSVDMAITNLAVFKYIDNQLTLIEIIPGATLVEVRAKTEAKFEERLR